MSLKDEPEAPAPTALCQCSHVFSEHIHGKDCLRVVKENEHPIFCPCKKFEEKKP